MRLLQQLCVCCAVIGSRGWTSHAFLLSSGAGRFSRPMAMLGPTMSDVRIHKDVVVIGGGLAGLSTALELAKRGKQVTVLSRNRAEAAAEAAGGMIAPQAERLESGPYLDLCLTSRAMYAEWVRSIEAIAGMGGENAGEKTAAKTRTHFWSTGGFMSPAFDGDAVHVWSPPPEGGQAHWIGRDQALEMEPSLSPDIVGAWWFPQDMSIDAQRMFRVLEQACSKGGVEILQGTAAASLVYDSEGTSVDAVVLEDGRQVHANAVVSATGAWMRELMPVPMVPHKGQMMALREPAGGLGAGAPRQGGGIGLTRVFFAEGCYIIPKRDGRVVVGSTVEVGEYGLHNTPAGIKQIIDAAVKVCPALADLAIERTWAGLRPVTPDCFPVLGASPRCPNLFVAGGYWRNGVLLAPKTAQLVADAVCGLLSPQDEGFLREFSMDRFTKPGKRAEARDFEPRAQPTAVVEPQRSGPTGTFSSSGSRAEGFISEASPSEVLEMERAALEGANDASMLSALEGMFGEGMVQVEKVEEENVSRDVPSTPASSTDSAPASSASTSKVQEPVNDYHASEQFSEEKLKEARMANRLLQEDSSDARLESVFVIEGGPEEAGLPEGIASINSWDDGAAEVASIIGAELVEMEVDIPDGMTIEEALAEQGPMMKVLLESPSGEEVEVPRGMNVAGMVEAGLIAPVGEADDDGEDFFGEGGAGARAWKVQKPPAGTFDPSAVKGAEERSAEVSELYAKVMANKAKAKGVGGGEASKTNSPATTRNGHNGSNVKVEDGAKGANSWLGNILAMGHGSGGSKEKREVEDAHSSSGDKVEGTAHVGAGAEVTSESEAAAGEAEEMVGYDFILKDRGDEEGKVARSARALARDAPEGHEAWENYEKIANDAMASVGGMETVEYLPP